MNKNTLAGFLLVSLFGLGFAGCAATSSVVPVGDGTYTSTREAGNGFATSLEAMAKLKAAAIKSASEFCATQGKQLKVVSVTEDRPRFKTASLAKVKVVFKALSAGDPELASVEPEPTPAPAPAPVEAPAAVAPTKAQAESLLFTPSKVTTSLPATPAPVAAPTTSRSKVLSTDELVEELTKLDDLRKKGILTDDEFQAEKKKVLKRSK